MVSAVNFTDAVRLSIWVTSKSVTSVIRLFRQKGFGDHALDFTFKHLIAFSDDCVQFNSIVPGIDQVGEPLRLKDFIDRLLHGFRFIAEAADAAGVEVDLVGPRRGFGGGLDFPGLRRSSRWSR